MRVYHDERIPFRIVHELSIRGFLQGGKASALDFLRDDVAVRNAVFITASEDAVLATLAQSGLAVIILPTTELEHVMAMMPQLVSAISSARAGQFSRLAKPTES